MARRRLLPAIVVVGLAVAGAVAQQQRPRIPPTGTIKKVRDNLYVIPGAGGNTTVFVTEAGVVLVDTKLPNNGEAILNQVRTVTDKPVSTIINTHSHPDHIGSNDYFPASVEVVTHENTRKWMAANPRVASNPAMMPDRTFTDRMTLGSGDDRIELYYFGAGHTDGDAHRSNGGRQRVGAARHAREGREGNPERRHRDRRPWRRQHLGGIPRLR